MTDIRASVIICVHNRAEQIQECLDSLLAMDARDFEIVLVDDASTDNTAVTLDQFRMAHPERAISIVRADHNLGVSGARNLGLHAACGELVFFTDSDCIVDSAWLEEMIAELDRSGATAVAGRVVTPPPTNLTERAYLGSSRIRCNPRQHRLLSGGNMGLYRNVAQAYLFDEALTYGGDEDDLAWRLDHDGHQIAFATSAIVQHNHPYTLRKYLRTAYRQGIGATRYGFKRSQCVGRDVIFTLLAATTLPFAIIDARVLLVTAACLGLQLLALVYNEIAFKGKSVLETVKVLPICMMHNAWKSFGAARTLTGLLLGGERPIRDSKRRWRTRVSAANHGASVSRPEK